MNAVASVFPPLTIALPLLAAALLMPFTKSMPRWISGTVATAATLAVMALCIALAIYTANHGTISYWMGGWVAQHRLAIGITFTIDPVNAGLATLLSLLVLAAVMYTCDHFDIVGSLFHTLLMAFFAAMIGYTLTGDIFNMFVWFELMTAAAIALTAHKIEESQAIEGAVNLAVTNTIAGFLVLLGIGLLYGRTGVLNLAQLGAALSARPADSLVVVAFLLIVCGYFIKGSVVPFHFWLDDAHAVAPTPVCVLFSGVMVQLALYGVARIYWTAFAAPLSPHVHAVQALFFGVGIATAVIGSLMAYSQRHLKRLLAFSTVSHSGMFVAAMGLFNGAGLAAFALFVAAHGLIKGLLFTCAGTFLNRFRSLDEGSLSGRGREAPVTAVLYLIGGIALAGAPPFGVSAAKAMYDSAFKDQGLFVIALVMAAASAVDAGAVIRSGIHVLFGVGEAHNYGISPREEETEVEVDYLPRTAWLMIAPAFMLLGVAIWLSFNAALWHETERAAALFVDRNAYITSVLDNAQHAPPMVPPKPHTVEDVLINIGVTLAAIVVALMGLFRKRIPQAVRGGLNAAFAGAFLRLRLLHSGVYTDYVAYMMFGIAAYGVWLVLSIR
jgi:multicomponent Na+:H+ antiporter subunit D